MLFRELLTRSLIICTNMKCNCKVFDGKYADFRHDNRDIVSIKEKKSTYKYYNKNNQILNHLAQYRVDGRLISDDGKKCDYLLLNCERKQAFFIELKSSDLLDAIKQITRNIEALKDRLRGFSIFARIALTRVNTADFRYPEYTRLQKKVESLNGNLVQTSRLLEEPLTNKNRKTAKNKK